MQGAKGSQVLVEKVVCLCVFEHASVSAGFEEDDAESLTTFKKSTSTGQAGSDGRFAAIQTKSNMLTLILYGGVNVNGWCWHSQNPSVLSVFLKRGHSEGSAGMQFKL